MLRKRETNELDVKKVNDVLGLTKKILNVLYIVFLVFGIYGVTMIMKEWKVMNFVLRFLAIVSPLFIGIVIAWLFDPIMKWLKKKGIRRKLGAVLTYVIFLGLLALVIGSIIPLLYNQISDFAKTIPGIMETIRDWIDQFFDNFASVSSIDVSDVRKNVFSMIDNYGNDLTKNLPMMVINLGKGLFSGLGTFLVGIIIGFFMLISFDDASNALNFLPRSLQKDARGLAKEIDFSLRRFVQGAIIDSTLIFVVSSLGLWIVGLKAPLLFGLFCGLTNVIPYAGPYIGGAPAVIVGFSQSPTIGILTIVVIAVIQFLEGNFLQPVIMAKSTKLHPVTIIIGLLVFGYFWGIFGMIVATPIIAVTKAIFMYFEAKYDWFNFDEEVYDGSTE